MKVTTTLGPVTVLTVSGNIDSATYFDLVREADQALDTGHVKLVIDLAGAGFVTSGGLVALKNIAGRASSCGGKMVLCSVGESVSEVLHLTGFDKALAIYPDLGAAKASFDQ